MSGVYDLEPLRYSYLHPVLQLDHELIKQQSPLFNLKQSNAVSFGNFRFTTTRNRTWLVTKDSLRRCFDYSPK